MLLVLGYVYFHIYLVFSLNKKSYLVTPWHRANLIICKIKFGKILSCFVYTLISSYEH